MLTDKLEIPIRSKAKAGSKSTARGFVTKLSTKAGLNMATRSAMHATLRRRAFNKLQIERLSRKAGNSCLVTLDETGNSSVNAEVCSEGQIRNQLGSFDPNRMQGLCSSERTSFFKLIDYNGLPTDMELVKLVHNRLQLSVIDRLLAEGVTKQEINLIAPLRTLAHRRANDERLTVDESDRAVRLARVVAQTESVFGNKNKALGWLRHPMKRFEGKAPIEMLVTDVGSRLVEEALTQIDEGFYA